MTRCHLNPNPGTPGIVVLPSAGYRRAATAIRAWPGYAPTPLHDLPDIASSAGVGTVALKDESGRFGLGSIKALGGAFAVGEVVASARSRGGDPVTVTCATDGNHGRSVAWGAERVGARCVVFIHEGVSPARADAIAAAGAEIRRVGASYDESVRIAEERAAREGWHVVSDTSWPGYTEVPRLVMQGYRLMVDEALDQWAGPPATHAFIQAGVGGIAAAVTIQLRARLTAMPFVVVVEPETAACLLLSAQAGAPVSVEGELPTNMACLACGTPSLIAWQELERATNAFLAVSDAMATAAVERLAALGIASAESGAAGLAGLLTAAADPGLRQALGLGGDSRVLLFNTEGALAA